RAASARRRDLLAEPGDARLAGHLGAHQADGAPLAQPAGDAATQARQAAIAHRAVHEPRGTEPAAPLAAPAGLDPANCPADPPGAQDLGGRLAAIELRQVAADDASREGSIVLDGRERPVCIVAGMEAVWPVSADDVLGALEEGVASRWPRGGPREELGQH